MASASYYAALSYGTAGLNAVHGIAYAVAGLTHQSHGSTNAVMLPYVLDELRQTRAPELLEIARLLGLLESDDEHTLLHLPGHIRSLVGQLGIPTSLADFGISPEQLPRLLQDALQVTRLAKAFPVSDVPAAYARIIERAHAGHLTADTLPALAPT